MVVHVQDSLPHEVLLGEVECIGSAERSKVDGPRRAWAHSEASLDWEAMQFDVSGAIREKRGLRAEKGCTEISSHRYPTRATVVIQTQGSLDGIQISEHWLLVVFPAVCHIQSLWANFTNPEDLIGSRI